MERERCVAVACGLAHSAALTDAGVLYTWGKQRDAKTSTPNAVSADLPDVHGDALAPTQVVVASVDLVDVACSNFHIVALDSSGGCHVAGLERGSRRAVHAPRPLRLPGNAPVLSIASGIDAVAVRARSSRRLRELFYSRAERPAAAFWRRAHPVDPAQVAVATADAVYAPDLSPGLACGAELRLPRAVSAVSIGWKHVVAAAEFEDT